MSDERPIHARSGSRHEVRNLGHQPGELKRHGGRMVFVFMSSDQLHYAIVDYANDCSVPVRSFCTNLRDLKALTR